MSGTNTSLLGLFISYKKWSVVNTHPGSLSVVCFTLLSKDLIIRPNRFFNAIWCFSGAQSRSTGPVSFSSSDLAEAFWINRLTLCKSGLVSTGLPTKWRMGGKAKSRHHLVMLKANNLRIQSKIRKLWSLTGMSK
jgi:hypothetical protein